MIFGNFYLIYSQANVKFLSVFSSICFLFAELFVPRRIECVVCGATNRGKHFSH